MRPPLDNPFYYLDNFQRVLDWVNAHHGDLLLPAEKGFIDRFARLPQPARALLVRMVMRKGELFRSDRLRYAEIGCARQAATALADEGWIDTQPRLSPDELFGLLTRPELNMLFSDPALRGLRKGQLLEILRADLGEARPYAEWCTGSQEQVFRVFTGELCQCLRLLFFGNLRQDWTDFVLADLGIHRYEQVAFSPAARAFNSRDELEAYRHLHACRERFEAGEPVVALLADIPATPYASDWLETRRGKLLLALGQQCERDADLGRALQIHSGNTYPGARTRRIRVLERSGLAAEALGLALQAQAAPENESEAQQLQRMLPRLRRALGLPRPARPYPPQTPEIHLVLDRPPAGVSVEQAVRDHLGEPGAPVHYVENGLINSLFGLLCWDAIFAPLPGAFFHPYHSGPADLGHSDFATRRRALFATCLDALDRGDHAERIRQTWRQKQGLLSPFVFWGLLDETLLELALACLPAAHLRCWFERLLRDVANNRSGLPDLIQFWPAEGRYRMIEVKGPGDRLQDNQRRWLDYALQHGLPVAVCHVRWAESA
ncbi:VRR-NUC domain-containing protein [Stutzerimonas tarimensis]|uniref:phosphodiesterase I n=1 Tax=Stutzerimonas tarimensis TaxID=1507735 RepID=A0ABV7T7F2_9GAMM